MLELLRAYNLIKEKHPIEKIEKKKFNHEKRLMLLFWTKNLEKKEISKGNTYMVRERVRWSVI